MKKHLLFWDIDGVLRDLYSSVFGYEPDDWNEKINNLNLVEYVSQNKDILLNAKTDKYYNVLIKAKKLSNIENVILSSQPLDWIKFTKEWLKNHNLNDIKVEFVQTAEEKLKKLEKEILNKEWLSVYLIDDYPFDFKADEILRFFVILIDKKYNKLTKTYHRIKSAKKLENFIYKLNKIRF